MSVSTSLPTPGTIYSKLVAIHIDELKSAINTAICGAKEFEVKGHYIKVRFDVTVSAACWTYFRKHGKSQLSFPQWEIISFNADLPNNTINMELTGFYKDDSVINR